MSHGVPVKIENSTCDYLSTKEQYCGSILSYIIKNEGGYKTNTLPDWLLNANLRSYWFTSSMSSHWLSAPSPRLCFDPFGCERW